MLSADEIFVKARRYCAYQERCTKQLNDKLHDWGVPEDMHDDVITQMKREGFIDDARYAEIFARGKFNTRKWGRIKIRMELQVRGIEKDAVQNALYAIDDDAYMNTLKDLLETKLSSLKKEKNDYIKRNKAAQSMMRKGYEGDLVWDVLRELVKE